MAPALPFPATAESVLSPLLIELHVDDPRVDVAGIAWATAIRAIPVTGVQLKVAVDRRTVTTILHTRTVLRGNSTEYLQVARLVDRRSGESAADCWNRWRWGVGLRARKGRADAAGGATTLRLEVTRYALSQGAVLQAAELALFRHLFVAGLQAIDPELTVIGGQYEWSESWWLLNTEGEA